MTGFRIPLDGDGEEPMGGAQRGPRWGFPNVPGALSAVVGAFEAATRSPDGGPGGHRRRRFVARSLCPKSIPPDGYRQAGLSCSGLDSGQTGQTVFVESPASGSPWRMAGVHRDREGKLRQRSRMGPKPYGRAKCVAPLFDMREARTAAVPAHPDGGRAVAKRAKRVSLCHHYSVSASRQAS